MGLEAPIDISMELSRQRASDEEHGLHHASLFNLIIYVHNPARVPYFEQLLSFILQQFPCRTLFIKEQGSANEPMNIKVLTLPIAMGDEKGVCEEVIIQVGESQLNQVPYLIVPNLQADQPVFLFWSRSLTDNEPELQDLMRHATRLIVDSDSSDDLILFSRCMLDWLQKKKKVIVDMNWAFISGWRDAITHVFDVEGKVKDLESIRTVHIAYNAPHSNTCVRTQKQAIYLQAWLAARLGWFFVSYNAEQKQIKYRSNSGTVEVFLTELHKEELLPGALINVEFSTGSSEYSFQRIGGLAKLLVHISFGDRCELPTMLLLPNVQGGLGFQREIFYGPPSPQYVEMLNYLASNPLKEA